LALINFLANLGFVVQVDARETAAHRPEHTCGTIGKAAHASKRVLPTPGRLPQQAWFSAQA
jgi:hypothetical protein